MTTILDAKASETSMSDRPASLRIAVPLARAEMRRLFFHPLVAVGLALTGVAALGLFGRGPSDLREGGAVFGLMVWPLAGMVLIAANLCASRPRRHGTEELFESLPGSRGARTLGHALSLVSMMVVTVVLAVAFVIESRLVGSVEWPSPSDLGIAVALVACAGAVGIAWDRLIGRSFAAPLVVFGIGLIEGRMASDLVGRSWHQLAPWSPTSGLPPELWYRPSGTHLVYIAGIAAILVCLAVLRDRRTRRTLVALIAAAGVTFGAGVMQVRHLTPGQVRESVRFVTQPQSVQRCEDRGPVTYCAYPAYVYLVPEWSSAVQGVLSHTPGKVSGRTLRVAQRIRGLDLQRLEPEVRARLGFTIPSDGVYAWPDDGAIHPDMSWCGPQDRGSCELMLAVHAASWAVGFPIANERLEGASPEDPFKTTAYDATGEARAVVALWLAGASTPRTAEKLRSIADPGPNAGNGDCAAFCEGPALDPPYRVTWCDALDEASVAFGPAELAYARQLLRRPVADVAPVVLGHWNTLVDPKTKSLEIVALFKLSVPPRAEFNAPEIARC